MLLKGNSLYRVERDIRWLQRFSSYSKVFNKLTEAIDYVKNNILSNDLMLPYTFYTSIFSQIENKELIDHINRVAIIFFGRKYY